MPIEFKPFPFDKPLAFVGQVRTIFYIMVGTPLSVFMLLYFRNRQNDLHSYEQELTLFWLAIFPISALVVSGYAYWHYERALKLARTKTRMRERLHILFQGTMEKFVMLEITTVIVLVAYFFTQHILYAGLYLAMLILFAMSNPTIYSVINDLRLPRDQASAMRQNYTIE